jgi:outer membrane PBP1 activator LpoA protein
MRSVRNTGMGMLLALGLAGCAVVGGQHGAPPPSVDAQAAQALFTKGQFDQAAQAYLALSQQDPNYADYYRLLAAEAYRQEGALDRSATVLADVRRQHLEGEDALRFDMLKAEIALKNNDPTAALALTGTPGAGVSLPVRLRMGELRARAQAAAGDPWSAANTRVDMDAQLTGLDREQNRKQVIDLLIKLGKDALAGHAGELPAGDRMQPWVSEALSQLGVAIARPPAVLDQPVGTIGAGGNANVREGYRVPGKLALLLPTSGALAGAGGAIRDGFFTAYLDAGRNNAPRPEVRVYDVDGDAAHAVAAYDKAVAEGAQFVVGPLSREAVSAIFAKGPLPVPLLTLNYPNDKTLPPSNASEFGLLPETEGAQVADHMIDKGLTGAMIALSTDDFARRAGRAFKAEFEARGGHIDSTITLQNGAVNFADDIKAASPAEATPPADAAAVANGETPVENKNGVFISMKPQQARLFMPQLRLAKNTMPVFGTSHVYGGVDDAAADHDLEGVEFCDAPWLFDAQPGLPRRSDLNASMPATRGVAARLFAFGMDAWGLAPYVDWMRAHPGSYFAGATGQLVTDEFGRVRRVLIWARFQDGVARPVAGSLELEAPATAPTIESGDG